MTLIKNLRSVARVLLFMLCCAAVLIATSALPMARTGSASILVLSVVSSAGALLLTYAFTRWESRSVASVGASFNRRSPMRFTIGLLIGGLILGSQWLLMWACGRVHWELAEKISPGTFATMVAAFMFLSAREEIAFHGFPLRRLHDIFGLWPAQICVAALFALEHLAGGTSLQNAVAGAAMGSLVFGMAAIASRGLAIPIGIHAAWNIGDWMRGGKATPGIWRPVVEPGHESYVEAAGLGSYVLVMAIATFILWFYHRAHSGLRSERPLGTVG